MASLMSLFTISSILWLLWRLVRDFVNVSTLDNLPGPKGESFLTGDIAPLFDRVRGWAYAASLRRNYGAVVRLRGLLGARVLYVYDPASLREILQNDAAYEEPAWQLAANRMVFGPGLFAVSGKRHHRQRKILNPVFSAENLRDVTPVLYEIAHKLKESIRSQLVQPKQEVDIMNWMSRVSLEILGRGGLGHSFDSLGVKDGSRNAVCDAASQLMSAMWYTNTWRMLASHIERLGPPRFRRAVANYIPHHGLQWLKWITDTLDDAAVHILQQRNSMLGGVDSKHSDESVDLLSQLVKANMDTSREDKLPEEEVLAQVSCVLHYTGTDTTSNALARTLEVLARHPDAQTRLRHEIINAQASFDEDIDYDTLMELPYLDAVCRETLRVYTPVKTMVRQTLKDTVMPLSRPIRGVDGKMMTRVLVPKDTLILLSVLDCNIAEDIRGPCAIEWNPERWLLPLSESVSEARIPGVYSNLMTFSGGKRSCIGFKYSQLEMKVVLSELVTYFRFSLTEKPIYWNAAGITFPSMVEGEDKASMLLSVELVQDNSL